MQYIDKKIRIFNLRLHPYFDWKATEMIAYMKCTKTEKEAKTDKLK